MKAVILAGGKGTRAKPFTDYFPKAMIPLNGKPLIQYVANYVSSCKKIDEIIIVTDLTGLGGQIRNYLGDKIGKKPITYVQDSQSGTAGDLTFLTRQLEKNNEFLLWFVDNLCAIDIEEFLNQFKAKKSLACVSIRTKRKEETGFAIVKNGIIKEFKEKPIIQTPMSECLGIYILSSEILKIIKKRKKQSTDLNLSFDILQNLAKEGKVSAYDIGEKSWADVESPAIIERNKKLVKKILKEMGL